MYPLFSLQEIRKYYLEYFNHSAFVICHVDAVHMYCSNFYPFWIGENSFFFCVCGQAKSYLFSV